MSKYSELLKDPRWQKTRLKKLEAAGWVCQRCWDDGTMLSVHHKRYVKGRMPWEYPEHELVVLCQPCHEEEHEEKEERANLVAALHIDGPASANDFFAVGAGYISVQTNDKNMHSAAQYFGEQNPYQFQAGRFIGALMYTCNVGCAGFVFMAEEIEKQASSAFRDDLYALFSKYELLAGEGMKL